MVKTLYHGSQKIIEKPQYGYGKIYNDYGLGFYCTDVLEMAKEWSVLSQKDGYANQYEMDCSGLKILNLNEQGYGILHWLAILLNNRSFEAISALAAEAKDYILDHFLLDDSQYDVITGYRADDSYYSFAQDFINGAISYRQLSHAMRLGKLGQQFVLKSEKAFERIQFVGYETAKADEWFARKERRDKMARREYFDSERNKRMKGDIYILQILDEEMKEDDPRLR